MFAAAASMRARWAIMPLVEMSSEPYNDQSFLPLGHGDAQRLILAPEQIARHAEHAHVLDDRLHRLLQVPVVPVMEQDVRTRRPRLQLDIPARRKLHLARILDAEGGEAAVRTARSRAPFLDRL